MIRDCLKCGGSMIGGTQDIPKRVPLPLPLNPIISIEQYLPSIMKKYTYYNVFICQSCGNMEVFLS
jgi:hypothetical protein